MFPPARSGGTRAGAATDTNDAPRTGEQVACDLLFLRSMDKPHDDRALQKEPEEWKTGEEPMTPAQRSYLETLARDTGESFNEELTKAEASKRIDELRERSPRLAEE
jgi:hypothetical protein